MSYAPLSREDVRAVIDGRGAAARVPAMVHFWVSEAAFGEQAPRYRDLLARYPCDMRVTGVRMPEVFDAPADDPDYRWVNKARPVADGPVGLDAVVAIEDWDELDEILDRFPNPAYPGLLPDKTPDDGRYCLASWWYCFFERLWSLRGMENALTDFYLEPDKVHRLFERLTDFYCQVIRRCKEGGADGIFTSDDIGTQAGPFFSLDIFREFFKPYYKRLIDTAHSLGMHFWLHSCGNIEPFLPEFIDIGLDVLHPIQKYSMDESRIAAAYGGKICFWAGFDVQQIIPYGSAEDVRREVRHLIDTYSRPDGRFMLTLGNGATADTPYDSLAALLDECFTYGKMT